MTDISIVSSSDVLFGCSVVGDPTDCVGTTSALSSASIGGS